MTGLSLNNFNVGARTPNLRGVFGVPSHGQDVPSRLQGLRNGHEVSEYPVGVVYGGVALLDHRPLRPGRRGVPERVPLCPHGLVKFRVVSVVVEPLTLANKLQVTFAEALLV